MIYEVQFFYAVCDKCQAGFRDCQKFECEQFLTEDMEEGGWIYNRSEDSCICPDCQKEEKSNL